ncbi:MAG: YceI family protein [Xanthomonadaceae bacterium]|nr:YceI family protein [Xanthomonadaceae bacterium]MDE2083589.1 YceI family protein [Xanthomonadaceae bacterium]MDE2258693.1 YceI family protein [Xanthomonadaceae bacterium]
MRLLRMRPVLLCLGLLGPIAQATSPRQEMLALDAARSQASFSVKVLWLIPLHGDFGKVQGTLDIDRFRGTARVDAHIDTDDLRMRSRNYQTWAKSPEFFDARRYPQIHFVSDDFPLVRLSAGGALAGTLTLRGVAKPVRFRMLPSECARPLSGACAVRAEGDIRRGDFGMHSRRGTLTDKVALRLHIFVSPAPSPPP